MERKAIQEWKRKQNNGTDRYKSNTMFCCINRMTGCWLNIQQIHVSEAKEKKGKESKQDE